MAQVVDIYQWRRAGRAEAPSANRWPMASPRDGLPPVHDQPDPGLVWEADVPDERASARLTMRDLLSTWRSAERFLEGMPRDGAESALVGEQITSLRAAYQRLFLQIRRGWTAR